MNPISSRTIGGYVINGFERGTVSDLNDPKKLNRVKVRLTDKDIETPFADVVSPMAGKNYGAVCIPQKGEEVLVGFCEGNISNPIVLGSLYNSVNKPPITVNNENEITVIKLSTGLTIEINTNKNNSNLSITTQKGNLIDIQDNSNQEVLLKEKAGKTSFKVDFTKGEIELKADKEITLTAGAAGGTSLNISSKKGLEVKTQAGKVKMSAKGIDFKSTANITSTANGSNNMKSNTGTNIQSTSMTVVKGAMVKIN